jgi:two-component system OmpR family response regulator
VLLVEDDRMIGEAMREALKDAAYAVDWVEDGLAALAAVACQHYDALLLDLGLPGKDGLQVLAALRSNGDALPVVIVTARDALEDRLSGLDNGADDYLLKPFDIAELLARLRAVLRRKGGTASPLLSNGQLTLDPASRQVSLHDGDGAIALSAREFSLLYALMLRPGGILSRSELEERIYGWGEEVESNAVEYLIHALRKKLGSEAIKNIRGVGWMVAKNG